MIEPYLHFTGQAAEAISFYESVFCGAGKQVTRVSDMPPNPNYAVPAYMRGWIAHASMTVCGTTLHFSDMQDDPGPAGMISLAAYFNTPEKVIETYHKLLCGGKAMMEPAPQFFASMYACVQDRFGVGWQLICETAH